MLRCYQELEHQRQQAAYHSELIEQRRQGHMRYLELVRAHLPFGVVKLFSSLQVNFV